MEERTREKYLKAARIMLHVFEGHRSRLPQSAHLATVVADGMKAAQALGIEVVTRELMAERDGLKAQLAQMQPLVESRNCAFCGKKFYPKAHNGLYCSQACKYEARKAKERALIKQSGEIVKKPQDDELKEQIQPEIISKPAIIKTNHCDRLHVTTMQPLPCGKREECFGENPCQFVPDRKQRASGSQWTKPIPVPSPLVREAFGIGCGLPAGDM